MRYGWVLQIVLNTEINKSNMAKLDLEHFLWWKEINLDWNMKKKGIYAKLERASPEWVWDQKRENSGN